MFLRPRFLLGAILAAASFALPARAEPVDLEALRRAQAILENAKQLMSEHRYDRACPELEEVVRLVPAGIGAKITLAKCYEQAGRLASAWAAYVVASNAATAAGELDRAKAAIERAEEIKPRVTMLRLVLPPELRGACGLEIKRDGKVVSEAEWDVALAVDPGLHAIEVSATKKKPWRVSAEARDEGTTVSVALPAHLEDAPAPPPPLKTIETGGVPVWVWPVGGVGLVLVGMGIGFLVDERVEQALIDKKCPTATMCVLGFDPSGPNERIQRDFPIYVGTGIAGLAAVGAAIAGMAAAPKRKRIDVPIALPWALPGGGGIAWEGRF